ncbi:MAG TPA: hypothetical protein VGW37_01610, partial [Terriglobia bacterium]|nr:hypothetical protein [Terriglobia bacterium]
MHPQWPQNIIRALSGRALNQTYRPARLKAVPSSSCGSVLFETSEKQNSPYLQVPRGIAIFARLAQYGNFPLAIFNEQLKGRQLAKKNIQISKPQGKLGVMTC